MATHSHLHSSEHTNGTDDIQDATASVKGLATATQISKLDGIAAGADVTGSNAPQAHAASHVGADAIQDATASVKGLATAAQITKLDGIEASADVTDFTNVNAALGAANAEISVNDQSIGDVNQIDGGDVAADELILRGNTDLGGLDRQGKITLGQDDVTVRAQNSSQSAQSRLLTGSIVDTISGGGGVLTVSKDTTQFDVSLTGPVDGDIRLTDGIFTVNDDAGDMDFLVKKNTTGNAINYDSGADLLTIGGPQRNEDYIEGKEIAAPGTPASGYGRLYVSTSGALHFIDDAGTDVNLSASSTVTYKSASLTSGASGTYFTHGFYEAAAADANLTQASATQVYGSANHPYAAHAFIVAGGAGTASGGTGTVEIEVSGTSITDAGVRTASDTEIIVADVTTMSTNAYYESSKKWLGQVTFTLKNSSGSTHTTFTADFNYGLNKYEDFGNRDFTVTDLEVVGTAGAADTGFNIELLHHKTTGWTYHATAFVAGTTPLVNMNTDHGTEEDLANGQDFAYKRAGLSTAITGSGSEGLIVRVTTGANNSVSISDIHVGVQLS